MIQKSILILLWVLVSIAVAMLITWIIVISAKPDPAEQPPKRHPLEGCVTYWDLLEVEHPGVAKDGIIACPHSWGYEPRRACTCATESCQDCWNRHVPKETLTRLMEEQ